MQNPFSSISNDALNVAQIGGLDAQAGNQQIQAERNAIENGRSLMDLFGRQAGKDYVTQKLGKLDMSESPYYNSIMEDLENKRIQNDIQAWNRDLGRLYNEKQITQSLNNMKAQYELSKQAYNWNEKLNDAQLDKVTSDIVRAYAEAGMLKKQGDVYYADAQTKNKIMDSVVQMYKNDASRSNMDLTERRAYHTMGYGRRNYMIGVQASDEELHNFITNQNSTINRIDKIIHAVSPISPSVGVNYNVK